MKELYLKKDNKVIKFTSFGGKQAIILTNNGCTYEEQYKSFNSAEEGNNFYKSLKKEILCSIIFLGKRLL